MSKLPTVPVTNLADRLSTFNLSNTQRLVLIDALWGGYITDPLAVQWGIRVDLEAQQSYRLLDKIRGVMIDNSVQQFNGTVTFLEFPDTGYVAACPVQSQVFLPVYSNSLNFIAYGIANAALTLRSNRLRFWLSDFPYAPGAVTNITV